MKGYEDEFGRDEVPLLQWQPLPHTVAHHESRVVDADGGLGPGAGQTSVWEMCSAILSTASWSGIVKVSGTPLSLAVCRSCE